MDEREIARRASHLEAKARTYRIMDLPGYRAWSQRKLSEGESAALIAHLDAIQVDLLPETVSQMGDADYEELLAQLKDDLRCS